MFSTPDIEIVRHLHDLCTCLFPLLSHPAASEVGRSQTVAGAFDAIFDLLLGPQLRIDSRRSVDEFKIAMFSRVDRVLCVHSTLMSPFHLHADKRLLPVGQDTLCSPVMQLLFCDAISQWTTTMCGI